MKLGLGLSLSSGNVGSSGWSIVGISALDFYAPFDGSDGQTSYTEISPNALSATMVSTSLEDTQGTPYGAGTALRNITSIDDSTEFVDRTYFDLSGDFTISIWYYRAGAAGSTREVLVSKYNTGGNQRSWALAINDTSADLAFVYSTDGTSLTAIGWDISADHNAAGWHHVYIERVGSTISAWHDGTSLGAESIGSIFSGSATLSFGNYQSNSTTAFFNGYLAEAIIVNDALGLGGVVPTQTLS